MNTINDPFDLFKVRTTYVVESTTSMSKSDWERAVDEAIGCYFANSGGYIDGETTICHVSSRRHEISVHKSNWKADVTLDQCYMLWTAVGPNSLDRMTLKSVEG